MIHYGKGREGEDGIDGLDPVVMRALETLEPGSWDPTYWVRFRRRVVALAARELARRRLLSELTVAETVASWGRTLVPTAVLVAAAAAFVLLRSQDVPSMLPVMVEEILVQGVDGAPIPTVLTSEDQLDSGGVMIAVDQAY
jgi:hypothetical protein